MDNKLSPEKQAEVKGIGKDLQAHGASKMVDHNPADPTPTPVTPNAKASSGGNTTGGMEQNPSGYKPQVTPRPQKTNSKTKGRGL